MGIIQILVDIKSQATRKDRASNLKKYLITDLEIISKKASEALDALEDVDIVDGYLPIKEVSARYGKRIKCKRLSPDGQDWLYGELIVNANLIREMEQGSVKDCHV